MGGAVGTFGAMNGKGREVQSRVAEILGLLSADVPTRANFDGTASYFGALGVLAGLIEKIAAEIAFLQRTEIGEVREMFHFGIIGSSTMAQKRNPSRSNNVVAVARMLRARVPLILESMVRSNEADSPTGNVGSVVMAEGAVLAASLTEKLGEVLAGLTADPVRIQHNFEMTRGLIMSEPIMMRLAPLIGRSAAHQVLYDSIARAIDNGKSLEETLGDHPKIKAIGIKIDYATLFDPDNYLVEAKSWIDDEIGTQKSGENENGKQHLAE